MESDVFRHSKVYASVWSNIMFSEGLLFLKVSEQIRCFQIACSFKKCLITFDDFRKYVSGHIRCCQRFFCFNKCLLTSQIFRELILCMQDFLKHSIFTKKNAVSTCVRCNPMVLYIPIKVFASLSVWTNFMLSESL